MAANSAAVQPGRVRILKEASKSAGQNVGPVVYWMFRDQRVRDNWALIHSVEQAHKANVPVAVAFNLFDQFLGAKARQLGFMLRGLRQLHHDLEETHQIPFFLFRPPVTKWVGASRLIDWDSLIDEVLRKGAEVPEIDWCEPGEKAAMEVLMGSKNGFLTKRLKGYSLDRNNPLKPRGLSGLSPYLHFGQISAQRCALEARSIRKLCPEAVDAFVEELIVRRELADNFCFYQPHYDSLQGAWEWARKTLMDHAFDKREHIYTKEQLEKAQTADPLWNASQLEMVYYGKMHGFMRMYWAKKILEWTRGPDEALEISIYLNNKGWKERPIFGKIRYMNYAGCKRKFDVDGYIAYVKRLGETKKRKAESLLGRKAKELCT